MVKRKAGLHKEITAIFDGVKVSKEGEMPVGGDAAVQESVSGQPAPVSTLPSPSPSILSPSIPPPQPAKPKPPAEPPGPSKVAQKIAAAAARQNRTGVSSGQKFLSGIVGKIKTVLSAAKSGDGNSRQKIMMVLVPVLAVVMIFVLKNVLSPPAKKTAKADDSKGKTGIAAKADIVWQVPELYPPTLRDPMQFGAVSKGEDEPGQITIVAILYVRDGKSSVVIGDNIYYEGDKVGGVSIVKINEDGAEFEAEGKKWVQKMEP